MAGVTREQIDYAKQVDILDYILSHEPDNVKRIGNAYYLKDHDSFSISNGLWIWRSQDIGGKNVVDYLIKVRGYSFVEAVRHLSSKSTQQAHTTPQAKPPPKEKPKFMLPPRNDTNERIIKYLQKRGISEPVIHDSINRGSVYESARWHNCVFVGRDDTGKARYATMRGTMGDFKRDADSSEKQYGFIIPPISGYSCAVAVFESPVDAISHQVLQPEYDGWRLSLGCTALAALTNFLERHSEVNSVIACTDNDDAGNRAAKRIAELPDITYTRIIPPAGKDWNEALQQTENEVILLEDLRKDILFLSEPFKYPEAFRIKDGESVKVTYAYDGEVATLKCRFIDECHLYVGNNAYHISELAERIHKNGNRVEPIHNQKPTLDILAAKYGDPLKDETIPMTEAALKNLVGGKYETEIRYVDGHGINGRYGPQAHSAILRGKDGIAVCGIGGENNAPTSLHPYWAQSYKRELSTEKQPQKASLLNSLEKAKEDAARYNATRASTEKPEKRHSVEIA